MLRTGQKPRQVLISRKVCPMMVPRAPAHNPAFYDPEGAHELDVATLLQEKEVKGVRLPVKVSDLSDETTNEFHNDVEHLPIVDLESLVGEEKEYTICRSPRPLKDSLNDHTDDLIENIIIKAKTDFPESSWVLVWKNEGVKNEYSVLAEEKCEPGEYADLTETLRSGKLNGCDLRGNTQTDQLGLVSNRHIPKDTVVAIECGVVWSEHEFDKFVNRVGDPFLGLSANEIPSSYLKELITRNSRGRAGWKSFVKKSRKHAGVGKTPGIIIACNTHGNETRYIDDPGWLYMSECNVVGTDMPEPNLAARVVLDLRRDFITVAFETTEDVPANTELTMDWGCWPKICDHMLPGQAQISRLLHARKEALVEIAEEKEVLILLDDVEEASYEDLVYFNPKDGVFAALKKYGGDSMHHLTEAKNFDKEFDLLGAVVGKGDLAGWLAENSSLEWCEPADPDAIKSLVRYAKRSTSEQELSRSTKLRMTNVTRTNPRADNGFARLKKRLDKNFNDVEIVEITDPTNPAKLFAIPGQSSMGIRALRSFRKNQAVIAYGGTIKQLNENTGHGYYFFDVGMPYEYKGPTLIIDGKNSIGGKINDPWAPTGFPKREANIVAFELWDKDTNTPQIVFYAKKNIKKGEELLYQYGPEYWKVMWITLMIEHAKYAVTTAMQCKAIRGCIMEKTGLDEEDLNNLERRALVDTSSDKEEIDGSSDSSSDEEEFDASSIRSIRTL